MKAFPDSGLLKPSTREKWEKDLFGGCYDRAQADVPLATLNPSPKRPH